MINNLDNHLVSIVIGIRYRANFLVADILGNILDKILYSRNAFFNEHFFPIVIDSKPDEKVLYNKEKDNRLTINTSNFILELNSIKEINLKNLLKSFKTQIVLGVMKDLKITQINRIGYINRYNFKIPKFAKSFIDKTIGKTFEGVKDINLQFSRKHTVSESIAKKEIYDYNNTIYNINKRANEEKLFISIDYQKYFNPSLESTSLIKYDKFIKEVKNYNDSKVLSWLNGNYGENHD